MLLRAALVWRQGARGQAVALLGDAIEEVVATKQTGLLMTQVHMLEPLLSALRQAKIMRTAPARRLLDTLAADSVIDLLATLATERGTAILLVTHEPRFTAWADRVVYLADGHIVDEMNEPTADAVLDRLKHFGD